MCWHLKTGKHSTNTFGHKLEPVTDVSWCRATEWNYCIWLRITFVNSPVTWQPAIACDLWGEVKFSHICLLVSLILNVWKLSSCLNSSVWSLRMDLILMHKVYESSLKLKCCCFQISHQIITCIDQWEREGNRWEYLSVQSAARQWFSVHDSMVKGMGRGYIEYTQCIEATSTWDV